MVFIESPVNAMGSRGGGELTKTFSERRQTGVEEMNLGPMLPGE